MKKKGSPKTELKSGKKLPSFSDLKKISIDKLTPKSKTSKPWFKNKKYWLSAIVVLTLLVVVLIWWLSQLWLVRSTFSQFVTYPKSSVLTINVGSLDTNQLNKQLASLKSKFENRKITLANGKTQWVFDAKKLGVTFDVQATSQAVWQLNKLSLIDKYRLTVGQISPVVEPNVSINNDTCVKALAVIPATQISSKDASVIYDQSLKIVSDQPETKFNAVLTCRELPKKLATNSFVSNVSLDIVPANLTKANLEPKLSQIQAIVGKPLSLKTSSGSYQLDQTPQQLLALLDISKKGSDVQISWSTSRLDSLVSDIASKVNTYNSTPALGVCQYVSSSGGNWLDTAATKKIFTDLGADSSRAYNLPISYHAIVIGNHTPVAYGNSGTIYLTFDDGMTYADQIMNYAACYGIKVTFFEIGERVGTDAVQLRRAIAEGHAVQSHGHYHAMYDYGARTYDWQYNDMSQSITDIMSVTGVRPTYFRPPGGNRSATTYQAASANNLKVILWGVSSADATVGGISSAQTCANVLAGVFPGASVLMHSTKWSSANAVPCIIEGLAARGYNMQALR